MPTSLPLIFAGEHSLMYIGAIPEHPPTPKPVITLPAYIDANPVECLASREIPAPKLTRTQIILNLIFFPRFPQWGKK